MKETAILCFHRDGNFHGVAIAFPPLHEVDRRFLLYGTWKAFCRATVAFPPLQTHESITRSGNHVSTPAWSEPTFSAFADAEGITQSLVTRCNNSFMASLSADRRLNSRPTKAKSPESNCVRGGDGTTISSATSPLLFSCINLSTDFFLSLVHRIPRDMNILNNHTIFSSAPPCLVHHSPAPHFLAKDIMYVNLSPSIFSRNSIILGAPVRPFCSATKGGPRRNTPRALLTKIPNDLRVGLFYFCDLYDTAATLFWCDLNLFGFFLVVDRNPFVKSIAPFTWRAASHFKFLNKL